MRHAWSSGLGIKSGNMQRSGEHPSGRCISELFRRIQKAVPDPPVYLRWKATP